MLGNQRQRFAPHGLPSDVDPTNDLVVSVEHVTSAWGRDYGDVSPVSGAILGGGKHTVQVAVDVLPIDRDEAL